jgi:hypothetical protein
LRKLRVEMVEPQERATQIHSAADSDTISLSAIRQHDLNCKTETHFEILSSRPHPTLIYSSLHLSAIGP